jgi:hypothetical protein
MTPDSTSTTGCGLLFGVGVAGGERLHLVGAGVLVGVDLPEPAVEAVASQRAA